MIDIIWNKVFVAVVMQNYCYTDNVCVEIEMLIPIFLQYLIFECILYIFYLYM